MTTHEIAGFVRRLCGLWACPELADEIEVTYSTRLRRALGIAYPERSLVRLHASLRTAPKERRESVICHELAHITVFRRHGHGAKPHGQEWKALVQSAGFVPQVRQPATKQGWQRRTRRFQHACPVCQHSRFARIPIRRWRCATCVEAGLNGELVIKEIVIR